MNFESLQSQEKTPREVFFASVKERTDALVTAGDLTEKYANGFLERAALIEGPFEDVSQAAESAAEYVKTLDGVVRFMHILDEVETRLVSMAGQTQQERPEDIPKAENWTDAEWAEIQKILGSVDGHFDTAIARVQEIRNNLE